MKLVRKSLLLKGTFFIIASSAVALLGFMFFFTHYLTTRYTQDFQKDGQFLLESIQHSLVQSMVHQDRDFIIKMFTDLTSAEGVSRVALYNHEGNLAASSSPGHGLSIDRGRGIAHDVLTRNGMVARSNLDGKDTLIITRTIFNEKRCQACHPSERPVLGALGIELSLGRVQDFHRQSRWILSALVAFLVLVLMAVNIGFFTRFVAGPLAVLRQKVRIVESGGRDVDLESVGGDEISDLEVSFGAMVKKLDLRHQEEMAREKEMALMVADFKHQVELSAVNKQLEARVRELDRANKKIRRMAVRLEEKNDHLERMVKRISALNRLGVALSSELELDRLLRLIVNVTVKGLRAEHGFLMLLDEREQRLRMAFGVGLGEEYDQSVPLDLGDSISGLVAQTGQPLLVENFNKETTFRRVSRFGFLRKSVICAPLKVKDRVLGTIELTNKKGEIYFNAEDLETVSSISAQAAIAIENAKLYQKIQKSYFDTIKALIQAVEEKDRYTRGHSERVTTFSMKIAEMMGLDQHRLEIIKYAGYLHDIGKIGIDMNILQKKGKLNEEEFTLIKNHPLIGERIIAPIEFLHDVRLSVAQHHERFDGFGYPSGIKGPEMSFEARILSVADAYDAMITDRPYRRALPKEAAVAELRRCSGTQFDPEVVEVFVELLSTDQEILELEKRLSTVGT